MHHHWLTWVTLAVVVADFADPDHYCSDRYQRLCQGKGDHVGCIYSGDGFGLACENSTAIEFTENLRHFVLSYINRRRQRIAAGHERVRGGIYLPKPEIMMLVEWDKELAFLAQRLANQCQFTHDSCRATVRYPYAGQTVGEVRWHRSEPASAARLAVGRVLDAWWGERRRVTYKQIVAPFKFTSKGAVWGDFSQLAVWTLRAAGCGATLHGGPPRLLLVCDYSHTNMLGQRTLAPGPPAPCPPHTARILASKYPLLCAPINIRYNGQSATTAEYDEYDDEEKTTQMQTTTEETTEMVKVTTHRDKVVFPSSTSVSNVTEDLKLEVITKVPFIVIRRKIHHPSEVRDKSLDKINARFQTVIWKHTTVTPLEHTRENKYIDHEDNKMLKKDWIKRSSKAIAILKYKPTLPDEDSVSYTETEFIRQRWQQTRHRPKRPGASALLFTPEIQSTKNQQPATMKLDKEDLEQLYRDTGFRFSQP